MKRWTVAFSCLCCFALAAITVPEAAADEPVIPYHQDKLPGPPLSPEDAIAKMTVPEGFAVELVASEPDIVNPVAMTFDARGRVWITESLEYPRLSAGAGRDRIKVLEDTNGDGRADKFTVFAEGLNIPSGIAVGYGGVWVANAPDILFLQDTDGDGRADRREVVVTGFGRDDAHELPNSLTWGADGWLYGLNGVFNHSHVQQDGRDYRFNAAVWRIHPRTRRFELFAEGTSNPWGITSDAEGSMFLSACVIDHLWHIVQGGYYHRQAGAYPSHTWKIESIVDYTHQKAAYCGIDYFDSDAYPPQYRQRLYMGNIHAGAINVDRLERNGATYVGRACPDFLTANDAWFMPVAQKTGPDGCLYVLDWYDRYHCYQDARRHSEGVDRLKGRLYRIRYQNSPRAAAFDLERETSEQLIGRLASPNVYFRRTAQRILAERSDPEAGKLLEELVLDSEAERKARLHALWALAGVGALQSDFHLRLLDHPDAAFRAWGVRAAGNMGQVDKRVSDRIAQLARDSAADVQLQVAIAAGTITGLDSADVLLDVLSVCGDDPLIPRIVWRQIGPLLDERSGELLAGLKGQPPSAALSEILPRVVDHMSDAGRFEPSSLAAMLRLLVERRAGDAQTASRAIAIVASKIENRQLRETQVAALRDELSTAIQGILDAGSKEPLYGGALLLAASWNDAEAVRAARELLTAESRHGTDDEALTLASFRALLAARDDSLLETVTPILADTTRSVSLRREMLASLGRLRDVGVAHAVLELYPRFEAALQSQSIEVLSQRVTWSKALLEAIRRGVVPRSAIGTNQIRKMLASRDEELARLVATHWGTLRTGRDPAREQVVGRMRELLAQSPGNPQAGSAVFDKVCGQCHKIYGRGQDVGPDLTSNGRSSFDQLLSNVFDPSLVIGAGYRAYIVLTNDGRVMSGLLIEDTDDRVALKTQGGKVEIIPRADIDILERSRQSLMPEGVENQLQPQEIVDLFTFLMLDQPPEAVDSSLGDSN